ncbi:hypothetical protein FHR72_003174 [Mycolicibacterium iranicum]|uniref:DUF998 domain-containing protein n=2 Tax=Mycolicibacterium iranicum TaxID=912594 RepID=A0A839Q6U6_MYCIR|nr:hypothetical protein [Mycolicibacterium iranicum]
MNIGAFMVHGSLFLAGAVVLARASPTKHWTVRAFVAAAAANAAGNILVGVFPSGSAQAHWHVLGAGLAIVGGNTAAIIGGAGSGRFGATTAFRRAGMLLGAFGIACLLILIVDGAGGSTVLPVGLVERGAVYPIIAWELLAAMAILRRGPDTFGG